MEKLSRRGKERAQEILKHQRAYFDFYQSEINDPVPPLKQTFLELAAVLPPRITLRQVIAFVEIGRTRGCSLSDLQDIAHDQKPVIGQSITRSHIALIDLGLITAERNRHDKRALDLKLTPEGQALFDHAMHPLRDYRKARVLPYRMRRDHLGRPKPR